MDLTGVQDEAFHAIAKTIEISHSSKPSDKAILFIHGFPSSPSTYRNATQIGYRLGYDVFAPRIPTFASDYRLFMETQFDDWYQYIKNYYLQKRVRYKRFYVIGTSMGGSIALKLAEEFSSDEKLKPTALCTIAAPVFINRLRSGVLRQPFAFLLYFLYPFKKAINPSLRYPHTMDIDGMEEWTGYNGIFIRQTVSFFNALKKIRRELPKINIPIYLIHDRDDKTVPFQNQAFIHKQVKSPFVLSESLDLQGLKGNKHALLLYKPVQEEGFIRIHQFFESRETEIAQKIDTYHFLNREKQITNKKKSNKKEKK